MNNFRVHYSGACFESEDSLEQVEKKVSDRVASLCEVLDIEPMLLPPDERRLGEENYIVAFEGEITVQADTKERAENQVHDRLFHLGQITVVASEEKQR